MKIRLLTIITAISDYLGKRIESLTDYLKTILIIRPKIVQERSSTAIKKRASKADDDEQFEINIGDSALKSENNVGNGEESGLKRKRKLRFDFAKIDEESSIDEDVKEIQRSIQNKGKGVSNSNETSNHTQKKPKKDYNFGLDSNSKKKIFHDLDSEAFKAIDDVLDNLVAQFSHKTRDQIMEVLKAVSFNIQNAFLYLSDPEANSRKLCI